MRAAMKTNPTPETTGGGLPGANGGHHDRRVVRVHVGDLVLRYVPKLECTHDHLVRALRVVLLIPRKAAKLHRLALQRVLVNKAKYNTHIRLHALVRPSVQGEAEALGLPVRDLRLAELHHVLVQRVNILPHRLRAADPVAAAANLMDKVLKPRVSHHLKGPVVRRHVHDQDAVALVDGALRESHANARTGAMACLTGLVAFVRRGRLALALPFPLRRLGH